MQLNGQQSPDTTMGDLQQEVHGEGHDYGPGSPHITHFEISTRVADALRRAVLDVLDRRGSCRVLEIGAGHGTFTDYLVASGASVVVTEMSAPSVAELRRRYRHNDHVEILPDADGTASLTGEPVDVVACISVLHHIPDYLAAVQAWIDRIRPGGAFVSFQDPMWYPRRKRSSLLATRAAYLAWRIPRGDLLRGLSTTTRRVRGVLDDANPSDMVEYHVVRQGVDERMLTDLLRPAFSDVALERYWSTQGGAMQAVGSLVCAPNTFGVIATNRALPSDAALTR